MKLKYTEIKQWREKLHEDQAGVCLLCGELMDMDHPNQLVRPVLDHCHRTGHVRAVIHGDCNVLLGKTENFTQYKGKSMCTETRLEQALEGMYAYMSADYSDNPLHPKHKSKAERANRALRNKYLRARSAAKTQKTRAKYTKLLRELK